MAGDQLQVKLSSEYVNLEVEGERGEGEEVQRVEVEGERGEVQEEQQVEVEGERGAVQEEQRVEVEGERGAVQEEQRVEVEGEWGAVQEEQRVEVEGERGAVQEEQRVEVEGEQNVYTSDPAASTGAGLRRSARIRQEPDRYSHLLMLLSSEQQDPCSVAEAKSSYDHARWVEAMVREMQSLHQNKVWALVEPPPNRKVIGSKWVFKRKVNTNGEVERHKACLVAQGFSQKYGLDYEETFSPVVRFESIRSVIALGAQHKLQLRQMDVSTAFLNGEFDEEVYMQQPEGFVEEGKEYMVCYLKRSIYGLKPSPRCWNHALDSKLREMKFKPTSGDPCLYVHTDQGGEMSLVAVYVDDLILGGRSGSKMTAVKRELSCRFEMKDLGALHHFLGIKVVQDLLTEVIWIGQPLYVKKILQRYQMQECKPVNTPVTHDVKLVAESPNNVCDQQMYQAIVGSLLYLSTKTRPDIAYAVGSIARFCARPTQQHWVALKRILRYLKGTSNYGLSYKGDVGGEITGYSDADWAGDITDRKSTSGYVFMQAGDAISWKSRKQSCVALSTAEAEYIALSAAVQEALWLQQITSDLFNMHAKAMTIFEDNQSTIALAKIQHTHGRTKHVDIKYHFIRDEVEAGRIKISYFPTEDMIGDIFTKGLAIQKFKKFGELAGTGLLRLRRSVGN